MGAACPAAALDSSHLQKQPEVRLSSRRQLQVGSWQGCGSEPLLFCPRPLASQGSPSPAPGQVIMRLQMQDSTFLCVTCCLMAS